MGNCTSISKVSAGHAGSINGQINNKASNISTDSRRRGDQAVGLLNERGGLKSRINASRVSLPSNNGDMNSSIAQFGLKKRDEVASYISRKPTTGPVGVGEKFYHELQKKGSGSCSVHALNAFIGRGGYSLKDVVKAEAAFLGKPVEDYTNDYLNRNGTEGPTLILADKHPQFQMFEGKSNAADFFKSDAAKKQSCHQALIASDGHWFALRKDTSGNWHKVCSLSGDQPIVDPNKIIDNLQTVHRVFSNRSDF